MAKVILRLGLAVAVAWLLIALVGGFTLPLGAVDVRLGLLPLAPGLTEVNLPPFGQVAAPTHIVPVKVEITWENIDLYALGELLQKVSGQDELVAALLQPLRAALVAVVVKILLLAALGGGLSTLIWSDRRLRAYLGSALVGVVATAGLLGGVAATYQTDAFAHPRYQGMLEMAPWMVGMAQETLADVQTFGDRMYLVGENIYELFSRLDEMPPATNGTVKLLHVSDIHNNPAAYRLIEAIATRFQVDAIIDTGDISDLGTPLEARLSEGIAEMPFSYLFVPGNHESPEILATLAQIPNIQIIDGQVVDIKGVRILGQADPAAVGSQLTPPTVKERKNLVAAMQDLVAAAPKKPMVLAVHNDQVAKELAGLAPVVIYGHNHQAALTENQGTWLVDAGSTGAAGIRGLSTAQEVPYTLDILYFGPGKDDLELKFVDMVKVVAQTSGFTLERRVINP